jgi:hypothetical protein
MRIRIKQENGLILEVDSENKIFIEVQKAAVAGNNELAEELTQKLIATGGVHFVNEEATKSTGIDVYPDSR